MDQIAGTILEKICDYLAAPVGRQLSYVFCFSLNVESLKIEADTLNNVKVGIQRRVDNGKRNIEVIDPTVQKWLDDADAAIGDDTQNIIRAEAEFPKGCFNRWFLNFKSRYALSRRAKKLATVVVKLQEQGQKFGNVSFPAPPKLPNVATSSSITLNSRVSKLNDIMESLKDDEIRMIGICGMGGVGKTTMMGEVLKKAKEENLFDEYAKTVVSQKADLTKIQSDIAEMLDLKLNEQSLDVRAGRINERLQGKKVLIILDDAWEDLDLQRLGIDLKGIHKGCKMLYTSRIKDLWTEFGNKRCVLELDVLPGHEAWNLFKEKVVDFPNDKQEEFVSIAKDIVKECGRLPLSLIILAGALRGKSIYTWRDTLLKLRTVGSDQKVIESLKLSYDHLGNDEAKSLFLLCGLFDEDQKIDAERLVDIGMGLRLFKGINSVAAARDRVFALLDHLQDCYLISTEDYGRKKYINVRDGKINIHVHDVVRDAKKYINVHDVVRDVSKSIASTEKGALIFERSDELKISQEQGTIEDSGWISVLSKDIMEFPTRLQCPRLELLICNHNDLHFADSCFEGMVKLQAVDLSCHLFRDGEVPNAPTLPGLALQYHKSLRTLCLGNCWMEDLTAIGNLPSLEILRVVEDKSITEVPKEIGKLTNLMVLDLSDCDSIVKISPGVISSLINLEELYIFNSEIDWEIEGNDEGSNASLRELKALSKLHTLHIQIKDPRALPGIPLFGHLTKYYICIGDDDIIESSGCEKVLAISLTIDVPLEREFNFLLYNSESVVLNGAFVKDMALKFLREGSQTIVKHLEISDIGEEGDSMDFTIAPSLLCTLRTLRILHLHSTRQIYCSPPVAGVFGKLEELDIFGCSAMTNIFSLSPPNEGPQTIISSCDTPEEEVDATRSKFNFLELKMLGIRNMPKLESFCLGIEEIQFPLLSGLWLDNLPRIECIISSLSDESSSDPEESSIISLFPPKVSFHSLNWMCLLNLENMKEIWCGQLQAGSFYNLAWLELEGCDSLQYVFRPGMAKYLVHLHTLDITNCRSLKKVIAAKTEEEEECMNSSSSTLPKLRKVTLDDLPTLQRFCHVVDDLEFSELEKLRVVKCPEFKTFAPGFVHTPKLNHVKLEEFPGEEKMIWKGDLNNTIQYYHADYKILNIALQKDNESPPHQLPNVVAAP